jgi:ribonuclease J
MAPNDEQLTSPSYLLPVEDTAFLLREKLRERGLEDEVELNIVPLGGRLVLGPFDIELVTLTHSIPEPNGLVIRTPLGVVLHTGDWKIDPSPLLGEVTDAEGLRALGDEGVLAMVCDSTNVFVDGRAGSEADVRDELVKVIAAQGGRVAVACFASNVARMETAIHAGRAAGRKICLVGRSMIRMAAAARHVGMDVDSQGFISEAQASHMPPDQVLLLCTGSQGEPRAALSRIAEGSHPHIRLGAGDSVIFSSRVIPGNEIAIRNMQDRLADRGVRLITDHEHPGIHVSGHPCRDELADMYAWARPRIAVPTHGERRHLLEHAAFARDLQVPQTVAPRNGDMVRLAPGRAEVIDEVPSGRIYIDGGFLTPRDGEPLRERRIAASSGVLHAALVLVAHKVLQAISSQKSAELILAHPSLHCLPGLD